jgi:hypothetical protein
VTSSLILTTKRCRAWAGKGNHAWLAVPDWRISLARQPSRAASPGSSPHGLGVVDAGPNLDRAIAQRRCRHLGGPAKGLVQVGAVQQVEPGDLLLGLGKRPIGRTYLAVYHPDGGRRGDVLQRLPAQIDPLVLDLLVKGEERLEEPAFVRAPGAGALAGSGARISVYFMAGSFVLRRDRRALPYETSTDRQPRPGAAGLGPAAVLPPSPDRRRPAVGIVFMGKWWPPAMTTCWACGNSSHQRGWKGNGSLYSPKVVRTGRSRSEVRSAVSTCSSSQVKLTRSALNRVVVRKQRVHASDGTK